MFSSTTVSKNFRSIFAIHVMILLFWERTALSKYQVCFISWTHYRVKLLILHHSWGLLITPRHHWEFHNWDRWDTYYGLIIYMPKCKCASLLHLHLRLRITRRFFSSWMRLARLTEYHDLDMWFDTSKLPPKFSSPLPNNISLREVPILATKQTSPVFFLLMGVNSSHQKKIPYLAHKVPFNGGLDFLI